MLNVTLLRYVAMARPRGPLHQKLLSVLQEAWKAEVFTQDSLAAAVGKKQTTVGQYLLAKKAGAFDLDEADAALRHIGSSLQDFLDGLPPRELTPTERLARALIARPELVALVEDLLPVPKRKLVEVIALARDLASIASGPRGARTRESDSGSSRGTRTTRAAKRRR